MGFEIFHHTGALERKLLYCHDFYGIMRIAYEPPECKSLDMDASSGKHHLSLPN